MPLIACREIKGGDTLVQGPLATKVERDALLIPLGHVHKAGVYGRDGALVRGAAYFRGLPEPHFPLEGETASLPLQEVAYAPDGPAYMFVGHLTGHYGHFLFALLSRLWALPKPVPADLRLVVLNGAHVDDLFEADFSHTIFRTLGLTRESFADFREPVRFREMLIPEPAVEENHLGHPAFAELCHAIGRAVLGGAAPQTSQRPVYLTKQRLPSGVHRIANEDVFCAELQRRGVEIVSPERLSFSDQVALWASRPLVMGTAGSMMHTSIFVPGRTYLALNPEGWVNSNQAILDRLNGNRGWSLYPAEGYVREEPAPGFAIGQRLVDPVRTAREFLREARRVRRGRPPGDPARGDPIRAGARRVLQSIRVRRPGGPPD